MGKKTDCGFRNANLKKHRAWGYAVGGWRQETEVGGRKSEDSEETLEAEGGLQILDFEKLIDVNLFPSVFPSVRLHLRSIHNSLFSLNSRSQSDFL